MFDWAAGFIEESGYIGIALLMLAENVFPPIPSELIMPLAGFAAARGDLNIVLVVLAGSIGSLLGAAAWYALGYWIGCEKLKRFATRHGRWLALSEADIDQAQDWLRRHGGKAVLIGRMVPAVRTLISVPAGLAHMPMLPFLLYSAAGTVLWSSFLAGAGYLLGDQYERVSAIMNPISGVVLGLAVLAYLYRLATQRRRKGSGSQPDA